MGNEVRGASSEGRGARDEGAMERWREVETGRRGVGMTPDFSPGGLEGWHLDTIPLRGIQPPLHGVQSLLRSVQ